MASSLFGALLLLPPLEMFLGAKGAEMLASLARVPVVRRESIPLSLAARQALTVQPEAVGYRDAASGEIDLTRVPGPPTVRREDHRISFHLDRGRVVALGLAGRKRRWGTILKINVRAEHDQLVLSSGYYPVGIFGSLCLLAFWFDWHLTPWSMISLLAVALVIVGVTYRTARRSAKAVHAAVVQELRARLAALASAAADDQEEPSR